MKQDLSGNIKSTIPGEMWLGVVVMVKQDFSGELGSTISYEKVWCRVIVVRWIRRSGDTGPAGGETGVWC